MRGVKGPEAWGLLVLGVLLSCGQLINGMEYSGDYGGDYTVRCTIGVQHGSRPNGPYDACGYFKAGHPGAGSRCKVMRGDDQNSYYLYTIAINTDTSQGAIEGGFKAAVAEAAYYGDKFVPGTLRCYDLDECVDKTSQCSPNAACYNEWATYKCECLDGYKDYSEGGGSRGSRCDKDDVKPADRPEVNIEIWVYILIGVAIFVVFMLVICCCCCYSGSNDCCPGMHHAPTKIIKRIKVIPQQMPVQAPCPPPPCICKPPEEKKIIIQVDQGPPQPAPAPAPAPPVEPMVTGHSAFIANSSYDGKVYIAGPNAQPVQATRALPWSDCASMQTVNPTVQYVQQEPQVQYVQQEPQVQYVQQQPGIQYSAPITTPYVYNVNVDPNDYYQ